MAWAFSQCLLIVERLPHGNWDGWAIWNSHARVLYRNGPTWQSSLPQTFHPDYPLLVPLMTARLWRWVGTDVPEFGGLIGLVLGFSGIALLAAIAAELRGVWIGLLTGLILLATPAYLQLASHQEADVPISIFIVGAIGLLCLYSERTPDRPAVLALAGFMAGCAGWTKNEGLLFIVAMSLVILVTLVRTPRQTLQRFGAFCVGLAVPLSVIIYFKFAIAPPNDLAASTNGAEILDKLLNIDRHATILASVSATAFVFGGWASAPFLPFLAGIALKGIAPHFWRRTSWRSAVGVLGIVLAGYYLVYVLTPNPLQWHLDTSLRRLLIQVWPSVLLVAAMVARDDPSSAALLQPPPSSRRDPSEQELP